MATKFYFQSAIGPNIAPAFSTGWSGVAGATRWNMYPYLTTTPIVTGTTISLAATALSRGLDRQYISPPLDGPQIISGQCSGRLMVLEGATTDNVDQINIHLKLVSRDGTFIRATGLQVGHYGNTVEFNTAYRTKNYASGTNLIPMTGQDGDRLVLEIGYCNSTAGTTPQASARWGDAAPDLPINETQTANGAGWFSMGNVDLRFHNNPTEITVS